MASSPSRGHFAAPVLLSTLVLGLVCLPVARADEDPSSLPVSSAPPSSSLIPSSVPESSIPPSSDPASSVPPSSPVPSSAPVSSVPIPPSQPEEFPDVLLSNPHHEAIMWARSNGYINGYEDGTFKPARGVSRVEALKMLYLASGGVPTDPGTATSFPDVRSDAWYAPFIRRAEADDIVHGYRDGRFRPDNTVTRVELLKIATRLNRLNHYSASGAPRFSDTPLGRWFVPYVNLAVTTGLVDAPGSTFSPDEAMAREEVAELLFRLRKALDAGQLDVFPAPFVRDGKLLVHVRAQGYASFYSDSLEGSGTANGEKYDPKALTCAHPSLPFGTLVTVSNPDTEKSVVCRVNDRGPYAKSRILDLSRASFESIERASAGVTRVNWEADVDLGA